MGDVPTSVREAAVAALRQRVTGAAVLDLTGEVVRGWRPGRRTRLLRFEGFGCSVVVEVRGRGRLSIDVRLRPAGPVLIEVLQVEGAGRVGTRTQGGHRVDDLAPGLTTFVVRWPDHRGRTPVRTAWMLL